MATRFIDLLSDTVTLPTKAMYDAIQSAELGDDVFDEEPTVKKLEALAAERMGKEAGLLVTSGIQGNLIGVLSHCRSGDEVIVGDQSHILHYEAAGCSVVGGLQLRTVPNGAGLPDSRDVEAAIRSDNIHNPPTGCICLENTHNRCGGTVFSAAQMGTVIEVAHRYGIPVHLDGARIFNAAVALGVSVTDLVRDVDSVTFCVSKGLCAPIGGVLCGSGEYIRRARKWRRMLGSGMRQAGIIAAPAIVAIETMVDRLADDHANAKALAEGLAGLPSVTIDLSHVQSNIVAFDLAESMPFATFRGRMLGEGVRVGSLYGQRVRMVTHYGIEAGDIPVVLAACRRVLGG